MKATPTVGYFETPTIISRKRKEDASIASAPSRSSSQALGQCLQAPWCTEVPMFSFLAIGSLRHREYGPEAASYCSWTMGDGEKMDTNTRGVYRLPRSLLPRTLRNENLFSPFFCKCLFLYQWMGFPLPTPRHKRPEKSSVQFNISIGWSSTAQQSLLILSC